MTGARVANEISDVRAAGRIASVDVLRGLAMVVMALDHSREFFTSFDGNPLDPQRTTAALYATRWITHLCAPVFVFLAGTSMYLQAVRIPRRELTRKLLLRGLWLVVAEFTIVHFVLQFNWRWNVQILEVIWVIGASMILMSALIHLGVRWNLILGALLAAAHNTLDSITPASFGRFAWFWHLLHVPGIVTGPPVDPPVVLVAYPLLPWVGVMMLGYAFGPVLERETPQRVRVVAAAGFVMLATFGLLRWSNLYGDPLRWTSQPNGWRTVLSFLNVQKYPPSLLFLLATLGLAALVMAAIELVRERGMLRRVLSVLKVYGRVPFFYFILHIAVIHALALGAAAVSGNDWRWWVTEFPRGGVLAGHPPGYGYGLPVVWCVWLGVVALCYPVCKWYWEVKRRSANPMLMYL